MALRRSAPLALMPAGAFVVHQLRYWLAFHSLAGLELRRQGHAYLHSLVPWIVLLVAVALGVFVRALGRVFAGRSTLPRYTLSFAALWLISAACLMAIYIGQEFLEGLFLAGHPSGFAGIFGYGGWWSIPAAFAIGLVLATAFHGARWVLRELAERCCRRREAAQPLVEVARPCLILLRLRLEPIAGGWSGRGPPA